MIKWFLSSTYGSYGSRIRSTGFEKKPYNPILGEEFHAEWNIENIGGTIMAAEQVSHHPPISAFFFQNPQANVLLNGHCGQKTKFTGTSLKVKQEGSALLFLRNRNEEYRFDFPELVLHGLLTGSPYLEIIGNTTITCTSGIGARIQFLPKPWFSGEYNVVKGSVYFLEDPSVKIYEISGKWTEKIYVGPEKSKNKILLLDVLSSPIYLPYVKNIELQSRYESRQVWNLVTQALNKQEYGEATIEKTRIEEEQRALRREELEKGVKWQPKLFRFSDESFYVSSPQSLNDPESHPNSPQSTISDQPQKQSNQLPGKEKEKRWIYCGKETLVIPNKK